MAITVQEKTTEIIDKPLRRLGYLSDWTGNGHSPRCKRKADAKNLINTKKSATENLSSPNTTPGSTENKIVNSDDKNSKQPKLNKFQSVINKDDGQNLTEKLPTNKESPTKSRRHRKFEPTLDGIEEENNDDGTRCRRDTLYTDDESPITLLIRQELDSCTRYRCLTLIQQVPSHRLYSKFYSSRPYLLAYTKWLANAGIYQSTGIRTSYRKSSLFPGNSSPRRGSLLPNAGGSRRDSMIPSINTSRRGSIQTIPKTPELSHEAAIEAIRLKHAQETNSKQGKFRLIISLFSCVSRSKKVQADYEQPVQMPVKN